MFALEQKPVSNLYPKANDLYIFSTIGSILVFVRGRTQGSPLRLKPIAVRLRQTRSDARSQALPGNVFRGGSATYELNRRQSRQEHVPRQSLGTSTGASLP